MSKPNIFNLISIFLIVLLVTSCKKDDSPVNNDPINTAPTIEAQSFNISEAISESTIIGNVIANDVDKDELSFSITNNSVDLFKITNDGAISLDSGKELDFETASSHEITVQVSDGTATANAQITLNVTDVIETLGFISTWRTTTTDESITIPTQNGFTYDYTVDWGDGTALTNYTENASHVYETANTYTVTVTGTFPSIYFSNNNEIKSKILSIEQWGNIEWQSMKNAFEGCDNLTYNATDAPNLTLVTDMSAMFRDAPSFNAADLSSWNVSAVTNMRSIFLLTPFNGDISNWDVSSVTDMTAMFFGAAFNSDISNWDVGNAIDMTAMFNGASNFNQDLSNWNTINVIDCTDFNANSGLASNKLPTLGPCFTTYVADRGLGFITSWQTTASNESITIPITATNVTIDWGDGTVTNNESNPSHTYVAAGIYDIIILGNFPSISFFGNDTDRDKIVSIKQWGENKWASMSFAFDGCANLTISATDAPNLSNVTVMNAMFRNASSLSADINHWDVSNVTSMNGMFINATSFNSDLSNWDVSSVTNMTFMFSNATSFNNDLGNWDVGSVTDMQSMFTLASSFNSDLSNWNVSSVTNMDSMFRNATSFNSDLNNWDVSSVTRMNFMFDGVNSFNSNLNNWNVSSVTQMRFMFSKATSFNGNLSNWDVGNVIDMTSMFSNATLFDGDISSWDVSSVIDMGSMFLLATSFNRDLNNWNVGNVTNMGSMFALATSFNGDLSNWNVSSVTNMNGMFNKATSFNGDISTWDISNVTQIQRMFLDATSFNRDLSNWNVNSATSMGQMFSNATSFNSNLNNWNVSNVTDIQSMFSGATSFNSDLNNWDVSNVTQMSSVFSNATLFNSDISSWDVSIVTNMRLMFLGATSFNQNLSNWNTINVGVCEFFNTDSALTTANLPTAGSCF